MQSLFLISILFFVGFSRSEPWTTDGSKFPNPIFDQKSCHRHENISSSVCDADDILGTHYSDQVQSVINDILSLKDNCGHGYEVGVAVVEKLDFDGSANSAIEKFARSVHDSWGVGDPKCNSGILFALSTRDRVFFFSTGSGASKIITTERIDSMTYMTALFADGDFSYGTIEAMLKVESFIREGPEKRELPDWAIYVIVFICTFCFLCCVYCCCIIFCCGPSKRSQYLKHKHRILDEYRNKTTPNKVCPVCLKEFSTKNGSRTKNGCGHFYHETCMEGQQVCPICAKMKLLISHKEDAETRVKFQYLSRKYPSFMEIDNMYKYCTYEFLNGRNNDPVGVSGRCRSDWVPPASSSSGHSSSGGDVSIDFSAVGASSGFSGGGFGGGHSSGGHGGHF